MKTSSEFEIIVTGDFENINEVKHSLQDPFVEDFVEERGSFRLQDFENIRVASGISLGDLEIIEIDSETYKLVCKPSAPILNKQKADELADKLDDYGMFDEIEVRELNND